MEEEQSATEAEEKQRESDAGEDVDVLRLIDQWDADIGGVEAEAEEILVGVDGGHAELFFIRPVRK